MHRGISSGSPLLQRHLQGILDYPLERGQGPVIPNALELRTAPSGKRGTADSRILRAIDRHWQHGMAADTSAVSCNRLTDRFAFTLCWRRVLAPRRLLAAQSKAGAGRLGNQPAILVRHGAFDQAHGFAALHHNAFGNQPAFHTGRRR
jgi:hypothetical protein